MKELEELPENWCIKIKKENIDLYKNTTKLGFGINNNYTIGGYYGPKQDEKGWRASISPRNRTLITDEDFIRLVLKKEKIKCFLCENLGEFNVVKKIFNLNLNSTYNEDLKQYFSFDGKIYENISKNDFELYSFNNFINFYKNKCITQKIFPILGYCIDTCKEIKLYLTKTQRKLSNAVHKNIIATYWDNNFYGNIIILTGLEDYFPLFTNEELLSIINDNKKEVEDIIINSNEKYVYLTILETPNPNNHTLGATFEVKEKENLIYENKFVYFDFNKEYKNISYKISKTKEERDETINKLYTIKSKLEEYKIGTKFNLAHLKNRKYIIESNDFQISDDLKIILNYSKNKSLFSDFARCVFYRDNWGEILKSEIIDKLYLNNACCKTRNHIIINYFKKKFPNCHNLLLENHTGISWNSNGFWYVIDVNKCKSPVITEKDFLLLLEQQGEFKNPFPKDENPCKEVYDTKIHEEFYKINDKKGVLYNLKPELIYEKEQNNLKDNKIEIKENEFILEIESFPELEFINITRI